MLVIIATMPLWGAAPSLTSNTWSGYHHQGGADDSHAGSISLVLVDDLTAYPANYSAVLDDWDKASNGDTGPLPLNSSKADPADRAVGCDNVATDEGITGTIHVCNDAYGKNGWLGLARIWLAADGHIEAGVALMNDCYLLESGSEYNNPVAWHVLCQENLLPIRSRPSGEPEEEVLHEQSLGVLRIPISESPNRHNFDTLNAIPALVLTVAQKGVASRAIRIGRTAPAAPTCTTPPRAGGG